MCEFMVESELQNPGFGFGCVNLEEAALFSSVTDRRAPSASAVETSLVPLQTGSPAPLGRDHQKCLFIKQHGEERPVKTTSVYFAVMLTVFIAFILLNFHACGTDYH